MRAKPPEQPSHHHPNNLPPTHPRRILISHHHLHLHLHLHSPSPPSTSHIHFTPTLIAMLVVAATAFLLVNYYRFLSRHLFPPFRRITRCYKRWRQRRLFLSSSHSDTYSLPAPYDISSDGFYIYSPYGLADSVINNIPLQIYKPPTRPRGSISSSSKLDFYDDDCLHDDFHDCAVCLLDFEDGDYMRTLPLCCHSFHADCIDMWLRAHATCPLCRAGAYESPLAPLMAARIRPSLDEGIMLESSFLAPLVEQSSGEIQEERNESLRELFFPDTRRIQSDNHRFSVNGVLKRSHSFSFETDRIGVGVGVGVRGATTTPHSRQKGLWMKRACSSTPYRSIAKSRVFLSLRITKSPVGRRRGGGYSGMSSETWSRRMIKSSRMRMGDPEALISPERY